MIHTLGGRKGTRYWPIVQARPVAPELRQATTRCLAVTNALALAAAFVFARSLTAQNVVTMTLSRPEAEFAEPFTDIVGVRELRGGRVILVDDLQHLQRYRLR